MHGGNVVICKDIDRNGPNNNIPKKPSLSGVNAGRLFQPSTWSGQDRVWKDILRSEDNQLQRGQAYLGRVATWTALEQIYPYLCGLTLTDDQRSVFQTKVEDFGRLFIRNIGEEHVTHYMVSRFYSDGGFVRPLPYCSKCVHFIDSTLCLWIAACSYKARPMVRSGIWKFGCLEQPRNGKVPPCSQVQSSTPHPT